MAGEKKDKRIRHVFFSYTMKDAVHARDVQELLLRLPRTRIFTPATLTAGDDWRAKLQNALSKSDAVVVLLSPDSVHSSWVMLELGMAWGLNKPIILILVKPGLTEHLPGMLRNVQSINIKDLRKKPEILNEIIEQYEHKAA